MSKKRKKPTRRVTVEYIDQLRARVKSLEEENRAIKKDRDEFRSEFTNIFRSALILLGKGAAWDTKDLSERLAKTFNKVQPFYWFG